MKTTHLSLLGTGRIRSESCENPEKGMTGLRSQEEVTWEMDPDGKIENLGKRVRNSSQVLGTANAKAQR